MAQFDYGRRIQPSLMVYGKEMMTEKAQLRCSRYAHSQMDASCMMELCSLHFFVYQDIASEILCIAIMALHVCKIHMVFNSS